MKQVPILPTAGEIIWTDFDPRVGHEQSGRRPALVLSDAAFSRFTGFALVCPITSRIRRLPTSVVLPEGLAVQGEVLVSHVRSIDVTARGCQSSGTRVPADTLDKARRILALVAGL